MFENNYLSGIVRLKWYVKIVHLGILYFSYLGSAHIIQISYLRF